jgi:hypothetical protein
VADLSFSKITQREDAFQLGTVLYELLTGFALGPRHRGAYYFPATVPLAKGTLELLRYMLFNQITLPHLAKHKYIVLPAKGIEYEECKYPNKHKHYLVNKDKAYMLLLENSDREWRWKITCESVELDWTVNPSKDALKQENLLPHFSEFLTSMVNKWRADHVNQDCFKLILSFIAMRQMDFKAACCILDHESGEAFYYENIEPYFDNWLQEKTPIVEIYTY